MHVDLSWIEWEDQSVNLNKCSKIVYVNDPIGKDWGIGFYQGDEDYTTWHFENEHDWSEARLKLDTMCSVIKLKSSIEQQGVYL